MNHRPLNGLVCHSESDLGFRITELAVGGKTHTRISRIGVEVAGKKIREFAPDLHLWTFLYGGGGKSSGREIKSPLNALATNVLASAVQPEQLLKVNVYLTSPDKLYQRQGARTFWFGSLVAVSAAAALIGLLAAWRAFRQQRELNEMKIQFRFQRLARIARAHRVGAAHGGKSGGWQNPGISEAEGIFRVHRPRMPAVVGAHRKRARLLPHRQGRKQYEFEPTDVVALVQTTVKLMEPNAAEKRREFGLETSNIEHRTPNIEMEIDGRADPAGAGQPD